MTYKGWYAIKLNQPTNFIALYRTKLLFLPDTSFFQKF